MQHKCRTVANATLRCAILGVITNCTAYCSGQQTAKATKFLAGLPSKPTFAKIKGSAPKGYSFSKPHYVHGETTGFFASLEGEVSGYALFTPDRIYVPAQKAKYKGEINDKISPNAPSLAADRAHSILIQFANDFDSDELATQRVYQIAGILGKPLHQAKLSEDTSDAESGICVSWKTQHGYIFYRQADAHAGHGLALEYSDTFPLERMKEHTGAPIIDMSKVTAAKTVANVPTSTRKSTTATVEQTRLVVSKFMALAVANDEAKMLQMFEGTLGNESVKIVLEQRKYFKKIGRPQVDPADRGSFVVEYSKGSSLEIKVNPKTLKIVSADIYCPE